MGSQRIGQGWVTFTFTSWLMCSACVWPEDVTYTLCLWQSKSGILSIYWPVCWLYVQFLQCWSGNSIEITKRLSNLFFKLIYFNWRLITSQYCGGFGHTLTWISHGCTYVPHPEPPCLLPHHPIPLAHQPWAAVSCIKLGLVIYFIYDSIHVSMLFSQIISPSPSPTESKSLFFTSVPLLPS